MWIEKFINSSLLAVGSFNKVIFYPREIFETATLLNTVSIMSFNIDIKNEFLLSQSSRYKEYSFIHFILKLMVLLLALATSVAGAVPRPLF